MKYITSNNLCLSSWITKARLLIEYKGDVNGHDNFSGNVPIHYAIDFDNMKLLKFLIEKGASIDIKAFDGTNALMHAVKLNPLTIVKILLENGADPNEKVNHGLTPLMIATQEGKYETAKLLIEHGANIDDHENLFGNVPLHFAHFF